jgi:hypothetical protein
MEHGKTAKVFFLIKKDSFLLLNDRRVLAFMYGDLAQLPT